MNSIRALLETSLEASISVATNQNFPSVYATASFSIRSVTSATAPLIRFTDDNDRLVAVYSHGCRAKYLRMRRNTTESDKTIKLRELNWTARSTSARDIHHPLPIARARIVKAASRIISPRRQQLLTFLPPFHYLQRNRVTNIC